MAKKLSSFNRFLNPLGVRKLSPFEVRRGKKRLSVRRLARLGLVIFAALVIICIGMVVVFSFDLQKPGQLAQYHPVASTKIYDRNGLLLDDIYGEEKRTVVETKDIPEAIQNATVAIEDHNFYNHHGVEVRSVFRAVFVDLISHSKSQGGSTITQQLVRNAIDDVGKKKSFIRKVKEVVLAVEFERIHTKKDILTYYLNEIPYGNNNYGIESASESYYGKKARELDPSAVMDDNDKAKIYAHIATLVALPQSPTFFNPYGNHADQLKDRRNSVLQKMAEQGYISKDMATKARAVDIADGVTKSKDAILAPHFVFYIREQLVDLLGGGQIGERRLASGGYKVTTTLDLEKQQAAEEVVAKDSSAIFKNTNASNAALVSIDSKTGQIVAMVGSVNFNDKTFGSVNITTAKRQPGSSFKPLVYATLFKKGFSPGSTLFDFEGHYDQAKPGDIWPHNYSGSGRGPLPIRSTLAQSLNISAVKAQALAGTKESIDTATSLGITTLGPPDQYGLSMVLGAAEVRMVDMVGAYSTFANNGVLHPVASILKVEDQNGQVIQEWKDQPKTVLDDYIAYELSSILSDNGARAPTFGMNSPLTLPDRVVAAKTGTTSNYRDAWTIGYTPQFTTAVWVGNNNNKEMTHSGAGAMAAAPIWHDFMVKVHKGLPEEQFVRPDSIKDCTIAKYSNKKPTTATPADNVVHDICSDAQQPTNDDDAWKTVKLYKPDQTKLATDATPLSLITTKVFTTIHSERPNDPVWENPVRQWASDNGISTDTIPTDTYDPSSAGDKLVVSIITPKDAATVAGTITLQSHAESKFGVSLMTFFVDNTQVAQPNAPWTFSLDTTKLADGKHTFKAVARDLQDQEESAQVTFTVHNAADSLTISGLNAIRSTDLASVTIFWTTNLDSDGLVSYGPTTAYGLTASKTNGAVKSHTIVITGLTPLLTYHYMVTSKGHGLTGTTGDNPF